LRAIVLVSPNNPTGAIYPPEVISRFHALCLRRGMVLVVDETYRDFLDPVGARPHDVLSKGSWRGSFISLYSFSKTYCIPGHRLGAIVADKATITEIAKILDCIQICASRTPQIALTWAINALASWREANTRDIIGRLAVFREALSSADGWQADSFGAYFAYVRHPGATVSSVTMARRLAEHVGILALPGSYFGERQEQYLRLAFANVDKAAISAVQSRLAAWAMTD
jgi:aspartate/methionine/tyrosine aminotransferase